MECTHCNLTFKTKYTLKSHVLNSKTCLKKRGLTLETKFTCEACSMSFASNINLNVHIDSCKKYIIYKANQDYEKILKEKEAIIHKQQQDYEKNLYKQQQEIEAFSKQLAYYTKLEFKYDAIVQQYDDIKHINNDHKKLSIEYTELKVSYKELAKQHEELKSQHEKTISKLEVKINKYDLIFQNMAQHQLYNEAVIELEENIEIEDAIEQDYKLQPLNLGNDMYIESREDGYINITNLCKAGGKLFGHWNSLDRTKSYLKALSSDIGIAIPDLVTHQTGSGSNQATWVHPYVAINIAQWISPQFDVKISSWIYEVMLTGKIDISKTKSFQQLRLENKEQKIKIQYLTKKYVKSQPRIQYTEQNVIYILTTPSHKKEGKYILGKATNLTNRLSVYNKTDEHEVVYYQSCGDEETMAIVEQFVFQRLKDYREQANRERFILPEGKTIDLFINVIKKTIG